MNKIYQRFDITKQPPQQPVRPQQPTRSQQPVHPQQSLRSQQPKLTLKQPTTAIPQQKRLSGAVQSYQGKVATQNQITQPVPPKSCDSSQSKQSHNNSTNNQNHNNPRCGSANNKGKLSGFLKNLLPDGFYNKSTKKFFGIISAEDLLLLALVFLCMEKEDEENSALVLALLFVLLSDYIDLSAFSLQDLGI